MDVYHTPTQEYSLNRKEYDQDSFEIPSKNTPSVVYNYYSDLPIPGKPCNKENKYHNKYINYSEVCVAPSPNRGFDR